MTGPYLTVDQAAQVAKCEHRTIRRAISSQQLPAAFGGRWLIDETDLHAWLHERGRQRLKALDERAAR